MKSVGPGGHAPVTLSANSLVKTSRWPDCFIQLPEPEDQSVFLNNSISAPVSHWRWNERCQNAKRYTVRTLYTEQCTPLHYTPNIVHCITIHRTVYTAHFVLDTTRQRAACYFHRDYSRQNGVLISPFPLRDMSTILIKLELNLISSSHRSGTTIFVQQFSRDILENLDPVKLHEIDINIQFFNFFKKKTAIEKNVGKLWKF